MAYRDAAMGHCGPSREIDVLWVTAGLGCDGDTIAITAATQPSLEEIVMGAIPGVPKVNFHNPFLSYENGEDFMEFFYRAAQFKKILLVGCEPATFGPEEGQMGLSPPVEAAVAQAVTVVKSLVEKVGAGVLSKAV